MNSDDAPGVGNHEVAVTASGALMCADDWCACGGRGRLLGGKDRLTPRALAGAVTRHREIHVQRPPETTASGMADWELEQMAQAWARERRLMASSDVDLAVEAFLAGWDARESTATIPNRQETP